MEAIDYTKFVRRRNPTEESINKYMNRKNWEL